MVKCEIFGGFVLFVCLFLRRNSYIKWLDYRLQEISLSFSLSSLPVNYSCLRTQTGKRCPPPLPPPLPPPHWFIWSCKQSVRWAGLSTAGFLRNASLQNLSCFFKGWKTGSKLSFYQRKNRNLAKYHTLHFLLLGVSDVCTPAWVGLWLIQIVWPQHWPNVWLACKNNDNLSNQQDFPKPIVLLVVFAYSSSGSRLVSSIDVYSFFISHCFIVKFGSCFFCFFLSH